LTKLQTKLSWLRFYGSWCTLLVCGLNVTSHFDIIVTMLLMCTIHHKVW